MKRLIEKLLNGQKRWQNIKEQKLLLTITNGVILKIALAYRL